MKNYKNLEELNKEWAQFGFRVNEKGEVLGTYEGKEYKVGQASFFTEDGKPVEKLKEEKKNKKKLISRKNNI